MGYRSDFSQYTVSPQEDARAIAHRASLAFAESGKGAVMPDSSYLGFVDSEGFDGGDAQMGVVGDGSVALEQFDTREVLLDSAPASAVHVSLRSGMKPILRPAMQRTGGEATGREVETPGADGKRVQRQQYENWGKQQTQRAVEKSWLTSLAAASGEEGRDSRVIAGRSSSEVLAGLEREECRAGAVDGEFWVRGSGLVSILLHPDSMVSEPFLARFTPDSPAPFTLAQPDSPSRPARSLGGVLPRRGTPQELVVRFEPDGMVADTVATLVVDAEDGRKWTFRINAST